MAEKSSVRVKSKQLLWYLTFVYILVFEQEKNDVNVSIEICFPPPPLSWFEYVLFFQGFYSSVDIVNTHQHDLCTARLCCASTSDFTNNSRRNKKIK